MDTEHPTQKMTAPPTPPRPVALDVRPENIPDFLKSGRHHCLWRYEFKNGRWTKLPFMPSGCAASSTDPSTWSTFVEVMAAYATGGWDGIGRIHVEADNLVGLDGDKVVDPVTGAIEPEAISILTGFGGYIERSPSGTGVRGYARGRKPDHRLPKQHFRRGCWEMYGGVTTAGKDGGRYLTLTGHILPGSTADVPERQDGINVAYAIMFPPKKETKATPTEPSRNGKSHYGDPFAPETFGGECPLPLTDDELKRWNCLRTNKTSRIKALWAATFLVTVMTTAPPTPHFLLFLRSSPMATSSAWKP